jgi:hypothetical protein
MSDPTDPGGTTTPPPYRHSDSAPFVYFDYVPTHGVLNGAVQVELAGRILSPIFGPDNVVVVEVISVAHLRCSPTAATFLRDALNGALKMLEDVQGATPTVATGRLN